MPQLVLEDFNLAAAERRLCLAALEQGGNIVNAAKLLGITRHAMKRRIIKLGITWPPQPTSPVQTAEASISPNT
jgi:DNA-binding NtrC family response regulator